MVFSDSELVLSHHATDDDVQRRRRPMASDEDSSSLEQLNTVQSEPLLVEGGSSHEHDYDETAERRSSPTRTYDDDDTPLFSTEEEGTTDVELSSFLTKSSSQQEETPAITIQRRRHDRITIVQRQQQERETPPRDEAASSPHHDDNDNDIRSTNNNNNAYQGDDDRTASPQHDAPPVDMVEATTTTTTQQQQQRKSTESGSDTNQNDDDDDEYDGQMFVVRSEDVTTFYSSMLNTEDSSSSSEEYSVSYEMTMQPPESILTLEDGDDETTRTMVSSMQPSSSSDNSKNSLSTMNTSFSLQYETMEVIKRQKSSPTTNIKQSVPPDGASTSGSSSQQAAAAQIVEPTLTQELEEVLRTPEPTMSALTKELESASESMMEKNELIEDIENQAMQSLSKIFSSDNSILTNTTANEDDLGVAVQSVARIPYVHGSYASAAPHMLRNPKWMRILRMLMPEAHADVVELLRREHEIASRRRQHQGPSFLQMAKIMKWAENNPVVAAFGITNSNAGSEDSEGEKSVVPALEWDVFLDPALVQKVQVVIRASENIASNSESDEEEAMAAEVEVDRQVGILIKRMLLAHGSASQLAAEAVGVGSKVTFSDLVRNGESQRLTRRKQAGSASWSKRSVRLSRRDGMSCNPFEESIEAPDMPGKASTASAGIFVDNWLSLFAKALQLADPENLLPSLASLSGDDDEVVPGLDEVHVTNANAQSSFCGLSLCLGYEEPKPVLRFQGQTTMAKSAQKIEKLLGSPLRVVLDLKSRRVPAKVWGRVIDNIRSRGIHVEGLGSFDFAELRSIASFCSSKVERLRFFHSAGDLQKACHANEVNVGDTVYFNAGSLFWTEPTGIGMPTVMCCGPLPPAEGTTIVAVESDDEDEKAFQPFAYPSYAAPDIEQQTHYLSTIEDYKKMFKLNIGCYIQEFSISPQNLDVLVRFINKHRSIYNLGLAYGGINGLAAMGLEGDGYWKQRYMGRAWDASAKPTSRMTLLHFEDHAIVQKAFHAGAWGHIGTVNDIGEGSPGPAPLHIPTCATMTDQET